MTDPCSGPGCIRSARVLGLCASHYRQLHRGRPRTPLRGPHGSRGDEARAVSFGVRLSEAAAEQLGENLSTRAREILEAWARRQGARRGGKRKVGRSR
jgi:hypothetical protein